MDSDLKAAVGLGNPGSRYAGTRHNLGFRVVERLQRTLGGGWTETQTFLFCDVSCDPGRLLLAKPGIYMNRSGVAVADLLETFDLAPADVLIVLDDVNLDPGRVRFRRCGSHGGHNGLRSIIDTLGGSGFPRLRVGIGRPPEGAEMIDYVLSDFVEGDEASVEAAVRSAAEGVICWRTQGLDAAMNRFNTT